MPASPSIPAHDPAQRGRISCFLIALLWIALQLGVLALAAFRVPLSARFPSPAEELAVAEMVILQTVAGALLFPLLFSSWLLTVIVVASSILCFQFAGFLAAQGDTARLVAAQGVVALWLLTLAAWSTVLRKPQTQLIGVAAALFLSAGAALLAYLYREFGHAAETFSWTQNAWMGPTVGALSLLQAGLEAGRIWYFVGCTALITGIALPIARWLGPSPMPSGSGPSDAGKVPHDSPQH